MAPQKALDQVGKELQSQYERCQPRARYKLCLDPTIEAVKKLCVGLRKSCKPDERVLFHYNGHGVPKPTPNGEIWVFNKNYTQYIPLSVYDLQSWTGAPSIYVFDCSAAGLIVNAFVHFAERREKEYKRLVAANPTNAPPAIPPYRDCILLGACSANETLSQNSEMPADLFTSCLTTPVKVALRWHCMRSPVTRGRGITPEMIDSLPGRLNDRKTPLGELNWIFTAITDTIAWNVLPRELFQKLFRQDLLVASLFRNFLLAERIMRAYNCSPVSIPKLPQTYQHHMWEAWEIAADTCIAQLPDLGAPVPSEKSEPRPPVPFKSSAFFAQQLTAFELWLEFASEEKSGPEQLPIVLQVLLSQVHRYRALLLLGRFLDLGPWALASALSVGIFPYVLKLLQSPGHDLKPVLVFIWAKILAVDPSCQADLVKDNGHTYFINFLQGDWPAEQRAFSAFVLAAICSSSFRPAQTACLNARVVEIATERLNDSNPWLRRWLCLCLAKLWENYDDAKRAVLVATPETPTPPPSPSPRATPTELENAMRGAAAAACAGSGSSSGAPANTFPGARTSSSAMAAPLGPAAGTNTVQMLCNVLHADPSPDVRASAAYALGLLMGGTHSEPEKQHAFDIQSGCVLAAAIHDPSPVVRAEVVIALSHVVAAHNTKFVESALRLHQSTRRQAAPSSGGPTDGYSIIWRVISHAAAVDPSREVSALAQVVQRCIMQQFPLDVGPPNPSAASGFRRVSSEFSLSTQAHKSGGLTKAASQANLTRSQSSSRLIKSSRAKSSHVLSLDEEEEGESLPLVSTFFDTCTRDFSLQKHYHYTQADYRRRHAAHERLLRSRKTKLTAIAAVEKHGTVDKLENPFAILDNEREMSSLLLFHPYEPLLVVSGCDHTISVWNYEEGHRIARFGTVQSASPINPSIYPRVTSLALLNPETSPLLLTGSDDGNVRIWGDFTTQKCRSRTSWGAAPGMMPGERGPGLVCEWQQETGQLVTAGGGFTWLSLWDVSTEQCVQQLATPPDTCITSLLADKHGERTVVAGLGDGSLMVFDCRVPASLVSKMDPEVRNWVISVHSRFVTPNEVISASVGGEIFFWDLRRLQCSRRLDVHKGVMTAFAAHDYAPILASGSHNQFVKVFNLEGNTLSLIRYHDGFLGQRIGPVASLSFHPHKLCLAAGATDSLVSIYTPDQGII